MSRNLLNDRGTAYCFEIAVHDYDSRFDNMNESSSMEFIKLCKSSVDSWALQPSTSRIPNRLSVPVGHGET